MHYINTYCKVQGWESYQLSTTHSVANYLDVQITDLTERAPQHEATIGRAGKNPFLKDESYVFMQNWHITERKRSKQ